MSMMKPSDLWKMAVGDRVRVLLKSDSSQKGKGKGNSKGKKTRKVSQVENRTKIGIVHVETVPVTMENEIQTLFRTFGG